MDAETGMGREAEGVDEAVSVWYCIPSKRPPEEAEKRLKLWRERGYKIALCRDEGEAIPCDHLESVMPYPGYASVVNLLVREVIAAHPDAEWLVTGGDDIEPDANHSAEEIARECFEHFRERIGDDEPPLYRKLPEAGTFGVMQPTGDRYGADERHIGKPGSAYIDRVCGSPWMGREFCRRMYGGRGPLCEEYFHMGEDEELQAVAEKLGVLWQRPDLIHFHRHWARARKSREDMPAFLKRANSDEEWLKYKRIFAARQAAGFPGHEPLEA